MRLDMPGFGGTDEALGGRMTLEERAGFIASINRAGLAYLHASDVKALVDHLIDVPHARTARIQEVHIMLGHMLCDLTDRFLFPDRIEPGEG